MPDASGNIKGIALGGKAGETLERIKRQELLDEISAIGQEQEPGCSFPKCECEGHQDDCPGNEVKRCDWCPEPATHEISGCPACVDCWEKAYNLD